MIKNIRTLCKKYFGGNSVTTRSIFFLDQLQKLIVEYISCNTNFPLLINIHSCQRKTIPQPLIVNKFLCPFILSLSLPETENTYVYI